MRSLLAVPVERASLAADVLAMRRKLEAARPRHDLKRGVGRAGRHRVHRPVPAAPARGEPAGLAALEHVGRPGGPAPAPHHHARACYAELRDAYEFLRTVEGRLRLIHNRSVSELPENRGEIERLARRLSDESAEPARAVESFLAEAESKTRRTREIFEQIVVADTTG